MSFVVLVISLNQDETWALPSIADGHLSKADLEEIIGQYLASFENSANRLTHSNACRRDALPLVLDLR
jgi:hypothetical protein